MTEKTWTTLLYVIVVIVLAMLVLHMADKDAHATPDWRHVPQPLMEAFVAGTAATGGEIGPILLAALSLSETEWGKRLKGSNADERGLFHMRDKARADSGCLGIDVTNAYQDSLCAARYLEIAVKRCGGSLSRGLMYYKTGYCWAARKGTVAHRVLRYAAEIRRHRNFQAWRRM